MKRLLAMRYTIRRNWQEDPVAFLLRLYRRKATERSMRLIRWLDALMGIAPATPFASLIAMLTDRRDVLHYRMTSALAKGPNSHQAKYLTDIAISADEPELAHKFAALMDPAFPGVDLTRAKLQWYNGHMETAVGTLGDQNPRTRRLHERYAAERDVFTGWVPTLEAVTAYEPREQTVLHLLTNSLPYTTSGYTQRSQFLLQAQRQQGWQVHAATRLGYPESLGILRPPKKQEIDGVLYHRLYPESGISNMRDRLQEEAEKMLALVLEVRPSVLHTTTHFVNGLVVRAVAAAVGLPWIYEVRGQLSDTWASKRGPEAVESERYVKFNAREADVARSASLVLTLGHAMRNRIIGYGIDPGNVLLVPNAVGEDFLDTPPPPRTSRSQLGLDPDSLYIGTVSSLVPYEGIDDLLSAYALLRESRDDVRLLVVGDGTQLPALRLQAAELGFDPQEIFPGRVPARQAAKFHRALDVFVVARKDLAVTRTVTPLKPVEAMASCRPVVASDLPALREMVNHGTTGLCIPPGDPSALAFAIGELLDDGDARSRMGFAGRAWVLASRTWEKNAELCIRSYRRLQLREAA